jgi:elongation factor 1-gamma
VWLNLFQWRCPSFCEICFSPRFFQALIAGKFGGVHVDVTSEFKMGVDNKTQEFLKLNPLGKVPTLSGPEGGIWESNAIARYVARLGTDSEGLVGKGAYEQSVVDQWIEFTNSYVAPNVYPLFVFLVGWGQFDKTKYEGALKSIEQGALYLAFRGWRCSLTVEFCPSAALGWIEAHLTQTGRHFLVNDRITLADIVLGCTLNAPLKLSLGPEVRSKFPKAVAYLERFFANDHVKAVLGETNFAASSPAQWVEAQAHGH